MLSTVWHLISLRWIQLRHRHSNKQVYISISLHRMKVANSNDQIHSRPKIKTLHTAMIVNNCQVEYLNCTKCSHTHIHGYACMCRERERDACIYATLVKQQNIFSNFHIARKLWSMASLKAEHETFDWSMRDFGWHDRLCTRVWPTLGQVMTDFGFKPSH